MPRVTARANRSRKPAGKPACRNAVVMLIPTLLRDHSFELMTVVSNQKIVAPSGRTYG